MADPHRMKAWRQAQRNAGLVPLNAWVTPETRARYQDLALTHRRTVSELIQAALDQYRPGAPGIGADTDTVSDTLLQHVLAHVDAHLAALGQVPVGPQTPVTETVTDTGTDTVETVTDTVTETITDTVTELVTETVTETGQGFDHARYHLGTLCLNGHDYQGTGQSLRANNKARYCIACNRGHKQTYKAGQRQKQPQAHA